MSKAIEESCAFQISPVGRNDNIRSKLKGIAEIAGYAMLIDSSRFP